MGKRARNIPALFDFDLRFKMMDQFGAYCQIISLASPPLEGLAGPDITPLLSEIANDGMAELVARYPDRFPGFPAGIMRCQPEVRNINQEPTPGFIEKTPQEFSFRHLRLTHREKTWDIFHHQFSLHCIPQDTRVGHEA